MIKKFLKSPKAKLITALAILIAGFILIGFSLIQNNNAKNNIQTNISNKKSVQTLNLSEQEKNNTLVLAGQVIPQSQIDIIALSQGNVQNLNFQISQSVKTGHVLAQLFNQTVFTNFSNAQINFNNMQASLNTSQALADQAVLQSELNLQSAEASVKSAEISLQSVNKSAETELANLYDDIPDIINNIYASAFYIINTLLDSMFDYDNKLTFQTSDFQAKIDTEWQKLLSDIALKKLKTSQDLETAEKQMSIIQDFLYRLHDVLDSAILDSNILSTFRTNANTGLNNINTYISAVNSQQQAINSQKTANQNNINIAQAQVDSVKIAYKNALASLNYAKQNKDSQILSAQTALDNARAQLNLAQAQINNLTIKSPISGQVTAKYVELGQEVSPGQKIAQISNLDSLKIKASLPSEYSSSIYLGQDTNLGIIILINPITDPVTKKINIEILSSNLNLIPGTFVDIEIPIKNNNKIFIPINAVYLNQDQSFVLVVENNKAVKKIITLGQSKDNLIQVVSGLGADDIIILNKDVEEGDLVQIAK